MPVLDVSSLALVCVVWCGWEGKARQPPTSYEFSDGIVCVCAIAIAADKTMPKLDGAEVVRMLREVLLKREKQRLPYIVMLTVRTCIQDR